jgi:hypothetical protein
MIFSLFPHLFQHVFFIFLPNMAAFPRPIIYFHHNVVQGGIGDTSHTPRIFFS